MGAAPIPSSVPDDRLDQVRTRYVQPDPNVEGWEEFYYADTGEVIPPDDGRGRRRSLTLPERIEAEGRMIVRLAAELLFRPPGTLHAREDEEGTQIVSTAPAYHAGPDGWRPRVPDPRDARSRGRGPPETDGGRSADDPRTMRGR